MKSKSTLSEEQIRPKNLMKKIEKFKIIDQNFLVNRKKNFKKVNCPACNNQKNYFYLKKNGFNYLICRSCKTFFVSPRPTEKILNEFYKSSKVYEFFNKFIFPQTELTRSTKIFKPRLEKLIELMKKYKLKKPSLIEIGPGYGTFCHLAKKSKKFTSIVAVEPSNDGYLNCKKKNIEVYQNTIENFKIKKKFDLVVNFEVIEHLFSPKIFLSSMKKLLKKNGFVIFTCPNGMGFDIQLLMKQSDSIDHEHLNYFNPKSVEKLLNNCGFKLIEIFTPGLLDVDIVRNKVLEKNFNLEKNNFLKDIIIDNYRDKGQKFQKFLTENCLSSNMWVIARSKK